MFMSPYETTVCKNHRTGDIMKDLERLIIGGDLRFIDDGNSRVRLLGPDHTDVKPFVHPIILEVRNKEQAIIVDVRSSARVSGDGDLTGGSDFQYMKLRGLLMDRAWMDGNAKDLLSTGDYSVRVYSRLMSENLGRRMNLAPETQVRLQIIAAYFYVLQYEMAPEKDDEEDLSRSKRISRAIGVPVPQVLELVAELPIITTITEFSDVTAQYGESIRLGKLSPGLIYTMLGGIWFGANANENVAVALEHPPTFIAMLYMATTNRGYRKSILGQMVQRVDRRGELGETFAKHVLRMTTVQ
jgi:hypothetical protein